MTKILVWNIQNFGSNRLFNPSHKRPRNTGGLTAAAASAQRRAVVWRVLRAATADIIVIVEVGSGDNVFGDLATPTTGMAGASDFLNRLNNTAALDPGGHGWGLVPPLRIGHGGKAEAVAVFYRRTSGGGATERWFTGPNIWTGGYNGWSREPGAANAAVYPGAGAGYPDINGMITGGAPARQIPVGSQHNGGTDENEVAARVRFREDDNGQPGSVLDFSNLREPYMVTFHEHGGGPDRDITIFGVHSPAVVGDQEVFLGAMASMYDVTVANGPNETRVVAGDFNVNLLDANGADANVYQALVAHQYQPLLAPPPGVPPVGPDLDAYKGYFATHIKAANRANDPEASRFLWSAPGNPSPYPGYGYRGSDVIADFDSVDNILVRPHLPNQDYGTTVLNLVTGTPFDLVNPPPGPNNGAPPGELPMNHAFGNAPNPWPACPAPNWARGLATSLRSWKNYGHIRSTSDHFAVYSEV